MTKDEMKNRISFALKDPVLQQGFECICRENTELDCQKNRNKFCYSCVNSTERCFRNEIGCPCEKYKSYKDEISELEKSCDETQELLDKQIEATYKVVEKLLTSEIEKHNKVVELESRLTTYDLRLTTYDLLKQ